VKVPMMDIRKMRMPVYQGRMVVPMGVRFALGIPRGVCVTVMRVVGMPVLVIERLVAVLMIVVFGEMQVDAKAHEQPSRNQAKRYRLRESSDG
jgi:bifunctional DNA-binding transcriptional regulator/antitoxin component of YhaV-PrlF toxin-antitoxin module